MISESSNYSSKSLKQWLTWIETQHPLTMDLGLERVQRVANELDLTSFTIPIITIAGTNGKGSCVALLQSIYMSAGYRIGAYTSPHLWQFNERICINEHQISDDVLVTIFEKIATVSQRTVSLTYFEYATLAALLYFQQSDLDVILLEVGMGGRLDAVNIIDPTVSVITSIGLDHQQWLGDDRSAIASEKSGIMREKIPVICGDDDPPFIIAQYAAKLDAPLYVQGAEFSYTVDSDHWDWRSDHATYTTLPLPILSIQNASTTLMVLNCLHDQLPVCIDAVRYGLKHAQLPGRCQYIPGDVTYYLDVAHNPAAIAQLAKQLQMRRPVQGRTYAIFSCLQDKDIKDMLLSLSDYIDKWYLAPIATSPRAATVQQLQQAASDAGITSLFMAETLDLAYHQACAKAQIGDRIVIFGSFHTVAELSPLLSSSVEPAI